MRRKKERRATTNLDPMTYLRLESLADRQGISLAQLIRRAIDDYERASSEAPNEQQVALLMNLIHQRRAPPRPVGPLSLATLIAVRVNLNAPTFGVPTVFMRVEDRMVVEWNPTAATRIGRGLFSETDSTPANEWSYEAYELVRTAAAGEKVEAHLVRFRTRAAAKQARITMIPITEAAQDTEGPHLLLVVHWDVE
jgi:hypothetical protein